MKDNWRLNETLDGVERLFSVTAVRTPQVSVFGSPTETQGAATF